MTVSDEVEHSKENISGKQAGSIKQTVRLSENASDSVSSVQGAQTVGQVENFSNQQGNVSGQAKVDVGVTASASPTQTPGEPVVQIKGSLDSKIQTSGQTEVPVSGVVSGLVSVSASGGESSGGSISASIESQAIPKIDVAAKLKVEDETQSKGNTKPALGSKEDGPQRIKAQTASPKGSSQSAVNLPQNAGGSFAQESKSAGQNQAQIQPKEGFRLASGQVYGSEDLPVSISKSTMRQGGEQLPQTQPEEAFQPKSGEVYGTEELPAPLPKGSPKKPVDSAGAQKEKSNEEKASEAPPDIAKKLGSLRDNDAALERLVRGVNRAKNNEHLAPEKKFGQVRKGRLGSGNVSGTESGALGLGRESEKKDDAEIENAPGSAGLDKSIDSSDELGPEMQAPVAEKPNTEKDESEQAPQGKEGDKSTKEAEPTSEEGEPKDFEPSVPRPPATANETTAPRGFFGGKKNSRWAF